MKKYLLAVFVMASMPLVAQDFDVDDDFGIDVSLGAEKELLPDLELSVEGDLRTQENSKRIERYVLGAELSYKFLNTPKLKCLSFGLAQ